MLLRRGLAAAQILGVPTASWLWWDNAAYDTVAIGRGDIEASVTASATLQPHESVDVGAQVSGQITRLHVQPGDRVQQGQSLAEIDASLHQATVEAGRAASGVTRGGNRQAAASAR